MMMLKSLIASMMLVSIVGCSSVQIVRVPVPVMPPKVELPQKPKLLMETVEESTPYDTLVKNIQIDYVNLIQYATELETLLKAYQGTPDSYFQSFQKEITVESNPYRFW